MTIQSNHYGVKIRVEFGDTPGCCGSHQIYKFSVNGNVNELTMGQKHEMYKELMNYIVEPCSGVLNATDCVLRYGPWGELARASSQWKQSDSAGDISLEDFCEYFGFTRGPVARNRNSGNLVATWTLAIYHADPENPDKVDKFDPGTPDFSDEPKPGRCDGADAEELIKLIRASIGA